MRSLAYHLLYSAVNHFSFAFIKKEVYRSFVSFCDIEEHKKLFYRVIHNRVLVF